MTVPTDDENRPRIGNPRNRPALVGIPRQRPHEGPDGVHTLTEAKQWLRTRLKDGEKCPCCGQLAKIYRRRIHHTIARSLIVMYRMGTANDGWVHVPTMLRGTGERGEIGKARYWGLVEEAAEIRQDGGRAGYWRLTDEGIAFVENRMRIKTHALIYDSRCLGFDGDWVNITDALGARFDYEELMEE